MGTKLKNLSYSTGVKAIAFLLVIVSFAVTYSLLANMLFSTNGASELFEKDYASSSDCLGQTYALYNSIETSLAWENEDDVANDEYNRQVADKLEELATAQSFLDSMRGVYYYASDGENIFTNCEMTTADEFKKYGLYDIVDSSQRTRTTDSTMSYYANSFVPDGENMKIYVAFEEYSTDIINEMFPHLSTLVFLKNEEYIKNDCLKVKNERMQISFRQFTAAQNSLENLKGIYYYAVDGEIVLTNCNMTTAAEFRNFKYHNIIEGYVTEFGVWVSTDTFLTTPGRNIFVAFDDDYMAERQAEFTKTKTILQEETWKILVSFIIGLLALVYLIFICGRDKEKNMNMITIDRLWTEITLGSLMAVVAGFSAIAAEIARNAANIYTEFQPVVIMVTAIFCAAALTFFLSLVRHVKNRTLIKHSLIYIIFQKIGGVFKTLFNLTPLKFKIVGSILGAALIAFILTAIGFGSGNSEFVMIYMLITIAVTIAIVYVILRFVIKPYDDEVNSRLDISLQKAMKAERLKTDLITNVSHDLKTPLTAILNYATLLLERDKDDEYAQVIHEKSIKLKTLTEDLFEVSKVQSGNIVTNIEKLNVAEFIDQILTETDEHIVEFKANIEDVSIMADGRVMSRVLENIIGNVNKYAMPGTRAYIDAFAKDGKTYIVFKNMANYEMNFDASEMTERFSRGDSSRTKEGNGLGLAIAQSYTEACGGKLQIDIDGDLFKVTLIFG